MSVSIDVGYLGRLTTGRDSAEIAEVADTLCKFETGMRDWTDRPLRKRQRHPFA